MSWSMIGFTTPWLLWALVALPVLWLILRAVPPAPVRRRFPGVALLLGLRDDDSVSQRTPWWLMLLRMLAVAAVIIGLAGPVLNPAPRQDGSGNLLVVLDGSWAQAPGWKTQTEEIGRILAEAGRAGRPVAVLRLTAPEPVQFQAADAWLARLPGLGPLPWAPAGSLDDFLGNQPFDTVWMSDGLARDSRATMLDTFEARGTVSVIEAGQPLAALAPPEFTDGTIRLRALRPDRIGVRQVTVLAEGRDPSGAEAVLASAEMTFAAGETNAETQLSLPAELRGRVSRFSLAGVASAGAVSLADDRLKHPEVALISGREGREGLELLSPLHYLERALAPNADLLEGNLTDLLPANPDVVVLADLPGLAPAEAAALTDWVEKGGLLLRFAGPKLAASDISRTTEDPLMPVRLRSGGRSVGGAMSWGAPKALAPFAPESPFFGLPVPSEVKVSAQVVAQPDPSLAERVIAALDDGTPLVTRKRLGQGRVVLFHVTANAEWSNLPLSGLFVGMLERLAVSGPGEALSAEELAGSIWTPDQVLDGFGRINDAGTLPGVSGEMLATGALGPGLHPGIYNSDERRVARNVIGTEDVLAPAEWPARIARRGGETPAERDLTGLLLGLALVLMAADVIAALAVSGRLRAASLAALMLALPPLAPEARAEDAVAIAATREVVLAHVLTGDRRTDERARAGLVGLSDALFFRTSVEPSKPMGVDLEKDELVFFPLLYWPITPDQPLPSAEAYIRLNTYLHNGGMILFDTADGDIAGFGASSPNGRKLQQLARGLDIPALEPLPRDHVLTRTFYLLQDWPGRFDSHDVWVEAAPADAEQVEGMPFRNLNDGVTPVVIGGNDWAGAWAQDDRGNALFPVGRGRAGERQRELAFRFGVNLVMHVLTGNYKSDQVHVPALLERLGQ